ncbi:MAG: hypothetical protein ACRESL_22900, partial [Pseudomonas sp.]
MNLAGSSVRPALESLYSGRYKPLETTHCHNNNAHGVASMISAHQFWRRAKLPLAVSLASTLAGP